MSVDNEKEYKSDIMIKTVSEMISQRGYNIIMSNEDNIIGTNNNKDSIIVFVKPVIKLNVDRIKEYINILRVKKMNHCIIIYTDSVTPPTKKLVQNSIDIKIEIFTQGELQYNITKHRLVPIHERLSTKEEKEFEQQFGLKFASLLLSDPISKFYNYQRDDIIKITRKSSRGNIITYRIVKD